LRGAAGTSHQSSATVGFYASEIPGMQDDFELEDSLRHRRARHLKNSNFEQHHTVTKTDPA